MSLLFAAFAGSACAITRWVEPAWAQSSLFISAAAGIQLRLLCNLLDGMVAIEGDRKSATGDLWNDVPDRVADTAILVGAGYALPAIPGGAELGWAAALVAVLTAYVRWCGRATSGGMHFTGPMAKQQRMALLTASCLAAATATPWRWQQPIIAAALTMVVAGGIITCSRRLRRTVSELNSASSDIR
jgi:phosphatidylglycerophosphate synthase